MNPQQTVSNSFFAVCFSIMVLCWTGTAILDGRRPALVNFCRAFQGGRHLTDIPGARAPGYKYFALPGLKVGQFRRSALFLMLTRIPAHAG